MQHFPLTELLPASIFAIMLVLCRVGAAIALMPGLGEAYVPARIRLVIAFTISLIVTPIVSGLLPPQPNNWLRMIVVVSGEIFTGSFIGLVGRVLLGALETAGAMIAMQTSLSSAVTYDPGANAPKTLPASLFGVIAVVLIFATNSHHMLLMGVVDSYKVFPPDQLPPFEDFSRVMIDLTVRGWDIAVRMAAPYLVLGTVFHIALALIGKIAPQIQAFATALPLQIAGGMLMFAATLSASMLWFLGVFNDLMINLTQLH